MEARASFRGAQLSTSVLRIFILALLSAFLLGGIGGYLVRPLNSTVSNPTTTSAACPAGSHAVVSYTTSTWSCASGEVAPQTFVPWPVPYSTPSTAECDRMAYCGSGRPASQQPVSQPTRDPAGNAVPI
jgi:hypothetical protein